MRDLAAARDVKASSVYAHYPSKEELFCRAVSVANEEISHRLHDALLAAQLREQAVQLVLSIVERGNATGDFACAKPHLAVAAITGMGIRVATWYRAPGRSWDRLVDSYADVLPAYNVQELAEEYTRYVPLVGCRDVTDYCRSRTPASSTARSRTA